MRRRCNWLGKNSWFDKLIHSGRKVGDIWINGVDQSGGGGSSGSTTPYLYLPPGWNTLWQSVKSTLGTSPAWVAFLGDSITQGFNSSDQMLKGFPRLVRAGLLGGTTPYADFFSPFYTAGTGAPWSFTNGATANGGFGGIEQTSNLAFTGTLTSPYACTQIDLWMKESTAGNWNYTIDGGANNNVVNSTGQFFLSRIPLTALSNATHTIGFNTQSAANVCVPAGASFYPNGSGGTGLGFVFSGTNGIALSSYNWAFCIPEGWAGRTAHNGGTYSPVFPQAPHLLILELGVNDCNTLNCTPDQYFQYLKSFVHQFRRGQPNCSIMLLAPCYPDTEASDTTNTFANQHTWNFYMDAMFKVAQIYNCALINMHAKWGATPQTQGFIASGNNVHPTDAGHQDIANLILGVL